jgi:hypothetical protein
MTMFRIARTILIVELVLGVLLSFLLDWSAKQHARSHGGLLLFYLAAASGVALWLLWRRSLEPQVAINLAALITGAFWTPLFYLSSVPPGSSAGAGIPNLAVALLFVGAAAAAHKISRLPSPAPKRSR